MSDPIELLKGNSLLCSHHGIVLDVTNYLKICPGNYLEIGVYDGVTMCSIALNNPNVTVIGIDPFIDDGHTYHERGTPLPTQKENCIHNISICPNIKLFDCVSELFLQKVKDSGNNKTDLEKDLFDLNKLNISVVYVDGSHHEKDIDIDVELSVLCIGNKKGIIIFDDLWNGDVNAGIARSLEKYKILKPSGKSGILTVNHEQ